MCRDPTHGTPILASWPTVDRGDAATAPADPDRPGQAFTGWDMPFDNVTSDLTVTASVSGSHGVISPASQTVDHGDDAHFNVTADAGYHGVLAGDTCSPVDNGDGTWTAGNITADCQVTASFAQNLAQAITIHAGDGQITPVLGGFAQALTVQVTDAADAPLAGITVTFSAPGTGASAVLSAATATTDGDGLASISVTANGIAGSYTVQAQVGGVSTPASFALENTALSASVSLTMSPASPSPGSTVTFTATVSGAGALIPGGSVDILVDGVVVCAAIALTNGSGSCVAGPFANAPHQAWASYAGDAAHAPADSAAINFEVLVPMPVPVNNPWALAWLVALFGLIGMPLARRRQRGLSR